MREKAPIGLFDSGVGGTTIWKEVVSLIPYENTLYLADNQNAPYGGKTKEEIIALCEANTIFLLEKNVKIIVVACNTGTTNAISYLRNKYKEVKFIGVEPAIKPAALHSRTKNVGILATKGTLSSELFLKTRKESASLNGVNVIEKVGEGLVDLIEKGEMNSLKMTALLEEFLLPMVQKNIDYLVLGCTHYPYLASQIKQLIPSHIKIIDSGRAVARQTKNVLQANKLLNMSNEKPSHLWIANADISVLEKLAPSMENLKIKLIKKEDNL